MLGFTSESAGIPRTPDASRVSRRVRWSRSVWSAAHSAALAGTLSLALLPLIAQPLWSILKTPVRARRTPAHRHRQGTASYISHFTGIESRYSIPSLDGLLHQSIVHPLCIPCTRAPSSHPGAYLGLPRGAPRLRRRPPAVSRARIGCRLTLGRDVSVLRRTGGFGQRK